MDRTQGTETGGLLAFFYQLYSNLVIIDKNVCLSEVGRGNRWTRAHHFQHHRPSGRAEIFFLSQDNCNLEWITTEAVSVKAVDGFKSPKYNDLRLGRDMAWYACPCGLLVNSFNWGGFVKDLYCYLCLVFLLSNLCVITTPNIMVRHNRVQYR